MSKILVIDLETSPSLVYTFNFYDTSINPEQVVEAGGVICFCAHWYGSKEYMFFSDWDNGHEEMIKKAHELISEADAVVGYNSRKFDMAKFQGEFILAGLKPPPPPTNIDLLKTVKTFGLGINKLAYIGPLLAAASKMKHEGFSLWRSVLEGDPKAQKRMERYCVQDVKLTTALYRNIKPYITDHPHLGETKANACGSCGSTHLQHRGFRRSKFYKTQRICCMSCGNWQTGKRTKCA